MRRKLSGSGCCLIRKSIFFCAVFLSLTVTGCQSASSSKAAETTVEETTVAEDPLRPAKELLQGEWQNYDKESGLGQNFKFDNGKVDYYWYFDKHNGEKHYSEGTYELNDSQMITTINDHKTYFDYEIRDGKMLLSYVDNHGTTQNFFQTSKGEYREEEDAVFQKNTDTLLDLQTQADTGKASVSTNNATRGELNALDRALSYLRSSAFSYEGLIDQLEYEGFTHAEAVYGADHCGADWKEQAVKSAKSYLSHMSFSKDGLIDQLEYEGFTRAEAEYGANQVY